MKKNFVVILTTFLVLVTTLVSAETVRIGVGSNPNGEYARIIVPAINEALQEYGYTALAETSAGAQEDIDKVILGNIPAALSQLDVATLNMTPKKDPNQSLLLLWGRIVPKALFCVAHQGGKIADYNDLLDEEQATPLKISVGNAKGETALTFQYMMNRLDLQLKNITFYHKGKTRVEINRLISGRRDLVCFLTIPDPENTLIKSVMEHDELFFIDFDHPTFDNAKMGKNLIYEIVDIPVSKGFFGFNREKVKTVVTWVGLIVNEKKIDEDLLDALAGVVMKPDLLPSNTVMAKTKRLFNKVVTRIEDMIE